MGRILFDQAQDARVILLPSLVTVKNSFNWTLRYKTKCSELSTSFNNQLYQEKLQFQNLAFECTINHVLLVQGDGQIYERQITRMGKKRKSSWKVREAA